MNGDQKPDPDAIAAKYGGKAASDPDAIARKYGGTTVETADEQTTTPPSQGVSFPGLEKSHPYAAAALEGPLDVLSGAGGELFSQAGRVAGLVSPRAGKFLSQYGEQQPGAGQALGRLGVQAAEFAAPAGLEKTGAGLISKALEGAPRIVRGLASLAPAAASSGAVSALQGTGFLPGAALGAAGAPLGAGLRKLGGTMATRAAGVTEKQLRYGAQPAEEILGLRGIRPTTIRESAQAKALELVQELESKVNASNEIVDLKPAKEELNKAINKAADQRSPTALEHLVPLAEHMAGIPDSLPAREALDAKRGLGDLADFQSQSPVIKSAKRAARQVYHAADEELDRAIPDANSLDSRIHSLVTIAKPRGTGRAGVHGLLAPWLVGRVTEAFGGGPLASAAGMLGALAGESPAARIGMGKTLAAAPLFGRIGRAPLLQLLQENQ